MVDIEGDHDCFWYKDLEKCKVQEETTDDTGAVVDESGAVVDGATGVIDSAKAVDEAALAAISALPNPMMGQVVYLVVALVYTAIPALVQFRWRINDNGGNDYYNQWVTNAAEWGNTNWWKIAY